MRQGELGRLNGLLRRQWTGHIMGRRRAGKLAWNYDANGGGGSSTRWDQRGLHGKVAEQSTICGGADWARYGFQLVSGSCDDDVDGEKRHLSK
ncbi:hypothetical protein M0R45_001869 [Rubus argutus]|uniref:MHC class I antigen n=1 Tax=Rubus argutus TaxID=59490 RepID=A0AAW1VF95_RUBAR